MDTIEREEIKWLWKPYIPYGKITIVQGDPGEGVRGALRAVDVKRTGARHWTKGAGQRTK